MDCYTAMLARHRLWSRGEWLRGRFNPDKVRRSPVDSQGYGGDQPNRPFAVERCPDDLIRQLYEEKTALK